MATEPKHKHIAVPTAAELEADRQRYPSVYIAASHIGYFSVLILLYSAQRAFSTGKWLAIVTGLMLCFWTLDLGGRVRRRARWAWGVAFVGALVYSIRWAFGSALQAWAIHKGNPVWFLAIMEPILFVVCLRVAAALLDRRSREAFGLVRPKSPPSSPAPLAEP